MQESMTKTATPWHYTLLTLPGYEAGRPPPGYGLPLPISYLLFASDTVGLLLSGHMLHT
jgi:hypothetical protein